MYIVFSIKKNETQILEGMKRLKLKIKVVGTTYKNRNVYMAIIDRFEHTQDTLHNNNYHIYSLNTNKYASFVAKDFHDIVIGDRKYD